MVKGGARHAARRPGRSRSQSRECRGIVKPDARILIVEDELPMRAALADLLAGEGYRVLTAADGESGLERALAEKPDVILLDVMMPKLDGFAVCAELRRVEVDIPVLLLTAKGQIEDRVS